MIETKAKRYNLVKQLACGLALAIVGFGLVYFGLTYLESHDVKAQGKVASFWECFYFSVVTLCTLGYGDFTPHGLSRIVASAEAIFGFAYFGYAVAQVVSLRQEALVSYSANASVVHTLDECIRSVADAKEQLGDLRRAIQMERIPADAGFSLHRGNPFYPGLKSLEVLNGYLSHISAVMPLSSQSIRIERAANHIEELVNFARKYVNVLESKSVRWKQSRTVQLLEQMCDAADAFVTTFSQHSKYSTDAYKAGGQYAQIVGRITDDIRSKLVRC